MGQAFRGVVEGANVKTRGKGGMKSTGLKVDGQWFNVYSKESFESYEGHEVSFEAAEGKFGWDIEPKTLKLHSEKPAPQTRAQAAAGASAGSAASIGPSRGPAANGARIGMSINCATLLIAHGVIKPAAGQSVGALVEAVAKGFVALAVRLEDGAATPAAAPVVVAPPAPPAAPQPPPPAPAARPALSFEDIDEPF